MKIVITAREALNRGVWIELCAMLGVNEWEVYEGLASDATEFDLTPEQAEKLGLIERKL